MKVKELVLQYKNDKIWLCPNIVSNQPISQQPYMCGMEFTSIGSIPTMIMDSEVVKSWKESEDNLRCIIWRNE